MVDIFDEVEEDLRAERARNLLLRYGIFIILFAVAIVAAAAGWQAWHWWQAKQDAQAASAYISAMKGADATGPAAVSAHAKALELFGPLSANGPPGYRMLARLREAALKADTGDIAGASVLWDQVAGDSSVSNLVREMASLLWAQHHIDDGDASIVSARLQALTSPGDAWRSLALEQLALIDLRQGKTDVAKDALRKLADDTTAPSGVRGRASSLVSRLGG